jgi:FAD/FMN-containing dehydrogenase
VDLFGELPYTALQSMFDETAPAGLQNFWKSLTFARLDDATAATLVSRATSLTSPLSHVDVHHLGGAVRRLADDATAYPLRGADYVVNVVGTWTDPADSSAQIAAVRDAWEALRPAAVTGSYVNFLADTGRDAVEAAYGPRTYARLSHVKRTYDPDNVFHTNHNVAPTARTSSA